MCDLFEIIFTAEIQSLYWKDIYMMRHAKDDANQKIKIKSKILSKEPIYKL